MNCLEIFGKMMLNVLARISLVRVYLSPRLRVVSLARLENSSNGLILLLLSDRTASASTGGLCF